MSMKSSRFPLLALNGLLNKLENDSFTDLEKAMASKYGTPRDASIEEFDSTKCLEGGRRYK